jgi:hypothetical protein
LCKFDRESLIASRRRRRSPKLQKTRREPAGFHLVTLTARLTAFCDFVPNQVQTARMALAVRV